MRVAKVIHRLLFVSAMLGIVIGPMSIGAADGAMAAAGTVLMDSMDRMDMPDDMPCCPDEQPIKPECGGKSCPLVVLCTTTVVGQLASSHSCSLNLSWVTHQFLMSPHAELASSLVDPPVRPPRV